MSMAEKSESPESKQKVPHVSQYYIHMCVLICMCKTKQKRIPIIKKNTQIIKKSRHSVCMVFKVLLFLFLYLCDCIVTNQM